MNYQIFLSKNFQLLLVKFSIHLNRHVFVMECYFVPLSQLFFVSASVCSYVTSGGLCFVFLVLANSVDPDQTLQNRASDQGLHCLLTVQECKVIWFIVTRHILQTWDTPFFNIKNGFCSIFCERIHRNQILLKYETHNSFIYSRFMNCWQ